jgi:hypothetical protein
MLKRKFGLLKEENEPSSKEKEGWIDRTSGRWSRCDDCNKGHVDLVQRARRSVQRASGFAAKGICLLAAQNCFDLLPLSSSSTFSASQRGFRRGDGGIHMFFIDSKRRSLKYGGTSQDIVFDGRMHVFLVAFSQPRKGHA